MPMRTGERHYPAVGGRHGGVHEGGQVHPQVVLLIDFLALIHIGALVGKPRPRRGIGKSQKRALPEHGGLRLARRRHDGLVVRLAQVAVDEKKPLLQRGVGFRRQQRMKLR